MDQPLYMPIPAVIEKIEVETPEIKTFRLRPEKPVPFRAGQFVELFLPGFGEAPFTPSSSPKITDTMEITIMRAGRVTAALHEMAEGDELGVRGPMGRAYPIEEFKGKDILVVGGGCGVGPLRSLLLDLVDERDQYEKVTVRYGAKTHESIVFRDAQARGWDVGGNGAGPLDVVLTVDQEHPDWDGHVGVITTILTPEYLAKPPDDGIAVMCGPPIMMKFGTDALLERGYRPQNIYLSMERNMSCGIGQCGHCRLGKYYICKDGPVFTYEEVQGNPRLWDD
ncbi:MAG: FAD/NAD(P)-binding protein [Xanthomonadales bacterium]|jgi:NAD(P)H-flavin reductase|nr:FAD/NAD(P)-binding protein [Xanthomonadales bacterium]